VSTSGFESGLNDPAASGVYFVAPADLDALGVASRDAGLAVRRVDLGGCPDKRTLLVRFAVALETPRGRGGNWDALADDLRDLDWLGGDGVALLLEDVADARDADAAMVSTLLSILDEAAAAWSARSRPFFAFVGYAPARGAPPGAHGARDG
jgi:hypothetical protein